VTGDEHLPLDISPLDFSPLEQFLLGFSLPISATPGQSAYFNDYAAFLLHVFEKLTLIAEMTFKVIQGHQV